MQCNKCETVNNSIQLFDAVKEGVVKSVGPSSNQHWSISLRLVHCKFSSEQCDESSDGRVEQRSCWGYLTVPACCLYDISSDSESTLWHQSHLRDVFAHVFWQSRWTLKERNVSLVGWRLWSDQLPRALKHSATGGGQFWFPWPQPLLRRSHLRVWLDDTRWIAPSPLLLHETYPENNHRWRLHNWEPICCQNGMDLGEISNFRLR